MTRDYKHRTHRPKHQGTSGWLYLLIGLGVGLGVAAIVYFDGQRRLQSLQGTPAPVVVESDPIESGEPAAVEQAPPAAETKRKLRFEFYTLLPESEVVIPEEELNPPRPPAPPEASTPSAPAETASRSSQSYMLQAGSFRHPQEASALKGELALIGIVADVQYVRIKGDPWYRVRIGPFENVREVERIRQRLRDNDVNAIAVKIKG